MEERQSYRAIESTCASVFRIINPFLIPFFHCHLASGYGLFAGQSFREFDEVTPGDLVVPIYDLGWHNGYFASRTGHTLGQLSMAWKRVRNENELAQGWIGRGLFVDSFSCR